MLNCLKPQPHAIMALRKKNSQSQQALNFSFCFIITFGFLVDMTMTMTPRESRIHPRERQIKFRPVGIITACPRGMSENSQNIFQEALKSCLTREIPPSRGILPLTHVGCPQSTGGHYIKNKSQTRLLEVKQIKVQSKS